MVLRVPWGDGVHRSPDGDNAERGQDGRERYRSDHNQRADEEDGPDQRREHDRRRAEDARPADGPPTARRLSRHPRTHESYLAVRRHRWCCPPEVSRRDRPLTR